MMSFTQVLEQMVRDGVRPNAETFKAFLGRPDSQENFGFNDRPIWAYDLLYDLLESEELAKCLSYTVDAARSEEDYNFRLWYWRTPAGRSF